MYFRVYVCMGKVYGCLSISNINFITIHSDEILYNLINYLFIKIPN